MVLYISRTVMSSYLKLFVFVGTLGMGLFLGRTGRVSGKVSVGEKTKDSGN